MKTAFLLASIILLVSCGGGSDTTPPENDIDNSEQGEIFSSQKLSGLPFSLPIPIDFSESTVSFDFFITGTDLENSSFHIDLNEQMGVPSLVEDAIDLSTLTAVIASQLIDAGLTTSDLLIVPTLQQDISDLTYHIEFLVLLPSSSQSLQIINTTENASEMGLYDSLISVIEN